jgi:hypothetical protein
VAGSFLSSKGHRFELPLLAIQITSPMKSFCEPTLLPLKLQGGRKSECGTGFRSNDEQLATQRRATSEALAQQNSTDLLHTSLLSAHATLLAVQDRTIVAQAGTIATLQDSFNELRDLLKQHSASIAIWKRTELPHSGAAGTPLLASCCTTLNSSLHQLASDLLAVQSDVISLRDANATMWTEFTELGQREATVQSVLAPPQFRAAR